MTASAKASGMPHGGFDYVKPEPKKSREIGLDDLKDLKKLFKL